MIQIGNKQLRNLEEQVLFNSNRIDSIIEGNVVLGELGIKVVGQATTVDALPDPATYEGNYGDAYLIGTKEPFDFYIFTRPFQGEVFPKWFNLGEFPVPGPEGPAGPVGPEGQRGERGNGIFPLTSYTPGQAAGDRFSEGDMAIVTSGTYAGYVLVVSSGTWVDYGTVRGPQGIQGPVGPVGPQGIQGPQGAQGPQGPVGERIEVLGEVANVDALPDPSSVERNQSIIATVGGVKHLFVVAGEGNALYWLDAGPTGIQGPPGQDGLNGQTGPQGPTGAQGPAGQSATVRVGFTSTLVPGAQATVTNTGTDTEAVLNFYIPRGNPGQDGAIKTCYWPVTVNKTTATRMAILRQAPSDGSFGWFYVPGAPGIPALKVQEVVIFDERRIVFVGDFFIRETGEIFSGTNEYFNQGKITVVPLSKLSITINS